MSGLRAMSGTPRGPILHIWPINFSLEPLSLCRVNNLLRWSDGFLATSPQKPSGAAFFRGGTSMSNAMYRAERCRDLAEECRRLAAMSPSTEMRKHYSRMAERYGTLAQVEMLGVAYECSLLVEAEIESKSKRRHLRLN